MNDLLEKAIESIKPDEGFRSKPYRCTAGKLTIGYGRNIEDVGIFRHEAEVLLTNDIHDCIEDLLTFQYWTDLETRQQVALINMRFCLGPRRFRQFRRMNRALELGDYQTAAAELLDSKFARQVGKRADRLAAELCLIV